MTTGIRTPVGLKISGADVGTIEQIGTQVEAALKGVQGTRSVFAEPFTKYGARADNPRNCCITIEPTSAHLPEIIARPGSVV